MRAIKEAEYKAYPSERVKYFVPVSARGWVLEGAINIGR